VFFLMALLFLATLLVLSQARLAPLIHAQESPIADSYIVVYRDDVDVLTIKQDLSFIPASSIKHIYQHAFKGYAANLTADQLVTVRQNPLVTMIEQDQVMRAVACSTPAAAPSWGLTRISERRMSLDGFYSYPTTAGSGVTAYIIDTGIYVSHSDFEGRATFGWKADSSWSNTDGNGHGTHVTGTVIGRTYGVAKKAVAIAVKVLGDDGSGTNSGVLAGVDWVISQYTKSKPSVINMSLGGGKSTILDNAVNGAVDAGIVVAVAAGNNNGNACSGSPSGASKVLGVGATDIGVSSTDVRSYFSNYGSCVNIFAPGSDITSSWIGGVNAKNTISGTSMASPHVAGAAALLLGVNPTASAASIQASLISTGTPDIINLQCSNTACQQSRNVMLYNGCDK